MQERKNVITFMKNPMTLLGPVLKVGADVPDFTLLANDLSPRTLADYAGKILVISVVPSLDTGLCDMQTRRFNNESSALDENVRILTISCDLPFAQARWCGAAGVKNLETLSDHRDLSFGLNWGVAIKELRLLTRSVFVVNAKHQLVYQQIAPEVTNEVDFDAALTAAKTAL